MRVLVIGGGVAGYTVAKKLLASGKVDVKLVDKKDYFEVPYAQLRALVDPDGLGQASRFLFRSALDQHFLQGEVVRLEDNAAVLADGQRLEFDAVVLAPGSRYPSSPLMKGEGLTTLAARTRQNREAFARFQAAESFLVAGGGIVGVELAGELASAAPSKHVRLAHSGPRLVPNLPAAASSIASAHLRALGVEVLLNAPDAQPLPGDEVYKTFSPVLATGFLSGSGALDEMGRIRVDPWLRVPERPHWYAVGDATSIPEPKHGLFASMQADFVVKHILAIASGRSAKRRYSAHSLMAGVPIGPSKGLIVLPFGVVTWKFLLNLKRRDFFTSTFRKL